MPTLPVFNTKKEEVTQIDLSDAVFGAEVREWLFYDAVRYQLAKRRSGNHAVKSRSQVPVVVHSFHQKGTGARTGTTVPYTGVVVVFTDRKFVHTHKMNKKLKSSIDCGPLVVEKAH